MYAPSRLLPAMYRTASRNRHVSTHLANVLLIVKLHQRSARSNQLQTHKFPALGGEAEGRVNKSHPPRIQTTFTSLVATTAGVFLHI